MSHHLYKTEAFVVASSTIGEANRVVTLLTSELGLVHAVAQGIREERSKLRFHVQDSSLITATLIRGKEVWRLASAGELLPTAVRLRVRLQTLQTIFRVSKILDRLIQGEERHPELYTIMQAMIVFLTETEVSRHELMSVEYITVLRILNRLGYIGHQPRLVHFTTSSELTPELVEAMGFLKRDALKVINASLEASHL